MEVSTNTQWQQKLIHWNLKELKTERFSMFQLFDEKGNLRLAFPDTHGQLCPKRFQRSLVLPLTVQIGISGKRTQFGVHHFWAWSHGARIYRLRFF